MEYRSNNNVVVIMTELALVQARVDKELKQEVAEIYEALGMDLPTAIRMFFVRSKMARGIPFETTLPKNVLTRAEALNALNELFDQASDVPEMSLGEIDAEIASVRAARKAAREDSDSHGGISNRGQLEHGTGGKFNVQF